MRCQCGRVAAVAVFVARVAAVFAVVVVAGGSVLVVPQTGQAPWPVAGVDHDVGKLLAAYARGGTKVAH